MPRIVIANEAGACFGVERALEMVRSKAGSSEVPVHTLGPLIHNPVVVGELNNSGVTVVDSPEQAARGDVLFLRTHGVPPQVEARAHAAGLEVVDATCPFVKKVHVVVEKLQKEGYSVIVVGEAGHPEVEGTLGHAPGAAVVGTAAEARSVSVGRKVGLVVQTTLAETTLQEVVAVLVGRCDELRVINTICDATSKRQNAAAELARAADVMVVIGGRNSANTTHLAQICSAACKRTHHIELVEELKATWFEGADLVGITAGASTPAAHIDAVRDRVEDLLD